MLLALVCGACFIPQAQPSADGRYLLFSERSSKLIVYDLERKRRAWSGTSFGGLGASGWAESRTIYLRDRDGLRLVSIPDGDSRRVAGRGKWGLAGSHDGRLLLFATGNGWGDGNRLSL